MYSTEINSDYPRIPSKYKPALGPLKACFGLLDQKIFEKLILSVLSTYFYLKGIDVACPVDFQHKKSKQYFLYKAILGPLKSCFDQLDQEFLKN